MFDPLKYNKVSVFLSYWFWIQLKFAMVYIFFRRGLRKICAKTLDPADKPQGIGPRCDQETAAHNQACWMKTYIGNQSDLDLRKDIAMKM